MLAPCDLPAPGAGSSALTRVFHLRYPFAPLPLPFTGIPVLARVVLPVVAPAPVVCRFAPGLGVIGSCFSLALNFLFRVSL